MELGRWAGAGGGLRGARVVGRALRDHGETAKGGEGSECARLSARYRWGGR